MKARISLEFLIQDKLKKYYQMQRALYAELIIFFRVTISEAIYNMLEAILCIREVKRFSYFIDTK